VTPLPPIAAAAAPTEAEAEPTEAAADPTEASARPLTSLGIPRFLLQSGVESWRGLEARERRAWLACLGLAALGIVACAAYPSALRALRPDMAAEAASVDADWNPYLPEPELRADARDPWGQPWRVVTRARRTHDLVSAGPNGVHEGGAGDDIVLTGNGALARPYLIRQGGDALLGLGCLPLLCLMCPWVWWPRAERAWQEVGLVLLAAGFMLPVALKMALVLVIVPDMVGGLGGPSLIDQPLLLVAPQAAVLGSVAVLGVVVATALRLTFRRPPAAEANAAPR